MKKIKKVFSVLLMMVFSVTCSSLSAQNLESKKLSERSRSSSSKEAVEVSLASKFQLLRARMKQYKLLNERFASFFERINEARESGEVIDEAKATNIAKDVGLHDAKELLTLDLQSLKNSPVIGSRAKQFLSLSKAGKTTQLEEEFDQLLGEIRADIEIAKSLGISVDNYEQAIKDYCLDALMCQIWLSSFTKSSST